MEKTFNFGKIDYMNRGRKDCAVDVTICLEERGGEKVLDKDGNFTGNYCNKYIEFTASGNIWNHCHSNIYSGGQNLDEIAKYIKTPLFKKNLYFLGKISFERYARRNARTRKSRCKVEGRRQ